MGGPRIAWLGIMCALVACVPDGSTPDPGASSSGGLTCQRAVAERNGVPFVRVCPADLPGVISTSFWIASAPVPCGGGPHETIACPPVISVGPGDLGAAAGAPIPARTAQLTDATTAHRVCALRFGGRLPTVTERAQARDAVGLASIFATIDDRPPAHLDLEVLPEWASALPCDAPSLPGAACGIASFPAGVPAHLKWDRLRACDATRSIGAGGPAAGAGKSCPLVDGARRAVACRLADPGAISRWAGPTFDLSCHAPTGDASHPPAYLTGLASFRCVVPEASLTGTISPAAPPSR